MEIKTADRNTTPTNIPAATDPKRFTSRVVGDSSTEEIVLFIIMLNRVLPTFIQSLFRDF